MNQNGNGKVETFGDIYEAFLQRATAEGLSENTVRCYKTTLTKFTAWADNEGILPAELTSLNALAYTGALRRENGEPYKPNTLRTHQRDITTFLGFAFDFDLIPRKIKVVKHRVPEPKREYLSDEEQTKLLAYIETVHPRDALVVSLLLDTGLRAAELVSLNWGQVSWDQSTATGTVSDVPSKGGGFRRVHFGEQSWGYLQATRSKAYPGGLLPPGGHEDFSPREIWRSEYCHESSPIFTRIRRKLKGERISTRALGEILAKMDADLDIQHLHPHLFRHSAIRNWCAAGIPLPSIMEMSGHRSLKIIQRYLLLVADDVKAEYTKHMNGKLKAA